MFGYYSPDTVAFDFETHIALVRGALDTWQATHALPLSSDKLFPGIEYPYYLFGNAGFYVIASFVSFVLQLPANIGAAFALATGLIAGQLGTYLLCRAFGLNRVYSAVLGFLYATGPYLCINLLVRAAFPEFLAWEMLPLLCFLGRRAMQPDAGVLSLACLGTVMAIMLYLHKLVGPHILVFEGLLIVANVRRSRAWITRLLVLGISVPCLTVFAWLPLLRLDRDQIVTLKTGTQGLITVINESPINYFWPWAQDSLPAPLREPQYGDRFALQIGLLASIGFLYGGWWLARSGFRPRHRELYVASIGFVIYTVLILGMGRFVDKLPFPLNTIQFSYRLLGLAYFSGLLALAASLGEAAQGRPRDHLVAAVAAIVVAASMLTYWRQPMLTNEVQTSIAPSQLNDQSAFFSKSFKGLLDTSGAVGPDGSLNARPFPLGLRSATEHVPPGGAGLLPPASRAQWPRTIFVRGEATASDFGLSDASAVVRVYALRMSSEPCATDAEIPADRRDLITALVALCQARRGPGTNPSVAVSGSVWNPILLDERTLLAPGPVDMQVTIPEDVFFFALECGRPSASPAVAGCLHVDYLGPANQPDGTVRVPQALPPRALSRAPFGQWTIRLTDEPPGDYLLPTFDYPFVRVTNEQGEEVAAYQFDRRPVIRFDGVAQTYSVRFDLSLELAIATAWAGAAVVLVAILVLRRVLAAGRTRRESTA